MSNDEMKANRYRRWYVARKQAAEIIMHLNNGGIVMIGNHLKAWQLDKRHVSMIKATKTGLYMQRGKNWDCIDGCSIKLYTGKV